MDFKDLKDAFRNDKVMINLDIMTPKQKAMYKWSQFAKWFTHTFYFVLYNAIGVMGWTAIIKMNQGNIVGQISGYSGMAFYGAGHLTLNLLHGIISWFTKRPKYDKKVQENGNAKIKKSTFRITMLSISLIPLFVWFIGWLIITIKYKTTKN